MRGRGEEAKTCKHHTHTDTRLPCCSAGGSLCCIEAVTNTNPKDLQTSLELITDPAAQSSCTQVSTKGAHTRSILSAATSPVLLFSFLYFHLPHRSPWWVLYHICLSAHQSDPTTPKRAENEIWANINTCKSTLTQTHSFSPLPPLGSWIRTGSV